jgi:hypothetical protein
MRARTISWIGGLVLLLLVGASADAGTTAEAISKRASFSAALTPVLPDSRSRTATENDVESMSTSAALLPAPCLVMSGKLALRR